MKKPTVRLLLNFIQIYFQAMEKSKYGSLNAFAKKYSVPNWTITRIKNAEPGDTYEPKTETILRICRGIIDNPIKNLKNGLPHATVELIDKFISIGAMPGMESDVAYLFKLAEVLSYKKLIIDQTHLLSFFALLDLLHSQVVAALYPSSDLTKMNS